MVFVGLALADDYSSWLNYKDITINTSASGANVSGNVASYPLLVRLDSSNFSDFSLSSTKASIRFARGGIHLPYQVERWDSSGGKVAEIWVLVDSVYGSNSSQTIRMYWNNVGVADSSSSSSVFNTSNKFQAVWHMNGTTATSNELDATDNNFTATYFQSAGSTTPLSTGGIGYSRVVTPASASTGPYFMAGVLPLNSGSATVKNARSLRFPSSSVGYAVGDGGGEVGGHIADGGHLNDGDFHGISFSSAQPTGCPPRRSGHRAIGGAPRRDAAALCGGRTAAVRAGALTLITPSP